MVLPERQVSRFDAGLPVLITPHRIDHLPQRIHGGQPIADLSRKSRDGLYVVIALATERVRAANQALKRVVKTVDAGRDEALECFSGLETLEVINVFREGQKLLTTWYPGRTARETMKNTFQNVLDLRLSRSEGGNPYRALIKAEHDAVLTAFRIFQLACSQNTARHDVSDEARQNRAMSLASKQILVNARQEYMRLPDLMIAAAGMDFNPSLVCVNVTTYATDFACGMRLGRLMRGFEVTFEPMHLCRLERMLNIAGAVELSSKDPDEEQAASVIVRDLALRYQDKVSWYRLFYDQEALKIPVLLLPKTSAERGGNLHS